MGSENVYKRQLFLITFSPAVSGAPTAMFPDLDFAWFPYDVPAIVSVPAAFIAGIIGTLSSKEQSPPELQAEMEVRSMTGAGAEGAIAH